MTLASEDEVFSPKGRGIRGVDGGGGGLKRGKVKIGGTRVRGGGGGVAAGDGGSKYGEIGVRDDDWDQEEGNFTAKEEMDNEVAMLAGGNSRLRQPRMSLLGKPLSYRAHRKDMRYRKLQARVYNFLERPKDWGAWIYHFAE